jgi:CheY-like chemotaxis protein
MKVLVVDDEDDIRTVATLSLGRVGGHDVVGASSGTEALQVLADDGGAFDAVVLDMQMPGMDGRTTLAAIREAGHTLPVVFLTAQVQRDERAALEALDVSGVLSKPFDPMTLARDLAGLLGWPS